MSAHNRPVKCELCTREISFDAMAEHTSKLCPSSIVTCDAFTPELVGASEVKGMYSHPITPYQTSISRGRVVHLSPICDRLPNRLWCEIKA
jgi:hypothetical protein